MASTISKKALLFMGMFCEFEVDGIGRRRCREWRLGVFSMNAASRSGARENKQSRPVRGRRKTAEVNNFEKLMDFMESVNKFAVIA